MNTLVMGLELVFASVFVLAFLWLFITEKWGRLAVCLIFLFWGIGTWFWPTLGKVTLGEWKAGVLLVSLLIAPLWAFTYRVLRSRLNDRARQHAALATWIMICIMFAISQPFAATIMLTVVDASDLLGAMRVHAYGSVSVLVLLFWTIHSTLVGGIARSEMNMVLGIALLTMVGALLLLPQKTVDSENSPDSPISAGHLLGAKEQ